MALRFVNIATGETAQAITPFHFFDYFNFSNFYHEITLFSIDNFFLTCQSHVSKVFNWYHHSPDRLTSLLERLVTLKMERQAVFCGVRHGRCRCVDYCSPINGQTRRGLGFSHLCLLQPLVQTFVPLSSQPQRQT